MVAITDRTIDQVLASPAVREALYARARLVLPRTQRVAAQSGAVELSKRLRVEQGTRPGAKAGGFQRPYARVIADIDDDVRKKDKGAKLTPRQIVRRGAK